jgi:hypothetical protein
MTKSTAALSARRLRQRGARRLRQRGDHFKSLHAADTKKISALTRENREAHRNGFIEGSADTLASVYAALGDLHLSAWLCQRMMSLRTRSAPYHLPPETEAMVRAEIAASLKQCEIPHAAAIAAEIEL